MNKFEIGDYLRHIYGVEVTNVNTHIVAGKVKRHRYARQRTIKRPDYKLAYVTLVCWRHATYPTAEFLLPRKKLIWINPPVFSRPCPRCVAWDVCDACGCAVTDMGCA